MAAAAARVQRFLSRTREPREAPSAGSRQDWISPAAIALLVGGITMVALALRLSSFGDSLWGDEITSYGIVSGHGPRTVLDLVRSDLENTPPLFYLLAWATERLGGPEGLRLLSLLAGVAAVPLTYLLGTRTVGRSAGLVGRP